MVYILLAVMLAVTMLQIPISANSAEPPSFTLIVNGAPSDLKVSIETADGLTVPLSKTFTAWETYFKFFYSDLPENHSHELDGMSLLLESGGVIGKAPLPGETFKSYNNLLTFDWKSQTLTVGQPVWRVPLLVAMRVVLTLLVEGLVFFIFGYRTRRSWTIFAAVNLITQTLLNLTITGPELMGYWVIGFLLAEAVIFIAESLTFRALLSEHKGRAVTCAYIANAASVVVGTLVISYLPV